MGAAKKRNPDGTPPRENTRTGRKPSESTGARTGNPRTGPPSRPEGPARYLLKCAANPLTTGIVIVCDSRPPTAPLLKRRPACPENPEGASSGKCISVRPKAAEPAPFGSNGYEVPRRPRHSSRRGLGCPLWGRMVAALPARPISSPHGKRREFPAHRSLHGRETSAHEKGKISLRSSLPIP